MTLHERIAEALGWTVAEVQSFSMQALRELLRPTHPKLVAELNDQIRSGQYIVGELQKRRRSR